jgi:hypothetical protein
MDSINLQQFVRMVHEMRLAQKTYFAARRQNKPGTAQALDRAKALEQQVDETVKAINEQAAATPGLFDPSWRSE